MGSEGNPAVLLNSLSPSQQYLAATAEQAGEPRKRTPGWKELFYAGAGGPASNMLASLP